MFGWLKKLFTPSSGPDTCAAVTPEEDIAIAERVMAAGDFKHAAYHIGAALVTNPNKAEWKALLDRLITIAPEPLSLAPLEDNNYVGTVAIRAYILAHLNRYNGPDGALGLITQIALAKPEVPYLDWLIDWLENPQNQGRIDLQYLSGLMGGGNADQTVSRLTRLRADPKNRPYLDRLPRVAIAALPHQTDAFPLSVLTVHALRQAGFTAEALEIAEAVHARNPGFFSAISLAATRRERGEWDAALTLYEEAHRYDPKEVSAMLDLGDLTWQLGRLDDAEKWYSAAIAQEPEQPWATPSLYGVRALKDEASAEVWREKLQEYALVNPRNDRANWVLSELYTPYFSAYLPEPSEATINAARQIIANAKEKGNSGDSIQIGLSHLECPSALRSVRRELARYGVTGFAVSVATISTPDPRKPTGPVDFTLWRYNGSDAEPAITETTTEAVTAAVVGLAQTPYLFSAWTDAARVSAESLGVSTVPALLSAMVFPPEKPNAEISDWYWMYRVQVASALLIGFLEKGWQGTTRRQTLLSLLHGPMDWSVEAALIALVSVAQAHRQEDAVMREIQQEVKALRNHVPKEGFCCWHPPLLFALINLPGTTPAEQQALYKDYVALQE